MPRIRKEPDHAAAAPVAEMEPPPMPEAPTPPAPTPPAPTPPDPTPPAKPVAVVQRRIETVTVAVPLGEIGPGYRSNHVQTFLDRTQAETMQRLVVGLRDRRAVSANGREIRSAADAVRWLLEQIGC